jgi:dTDP-4-amino-4,6-dideoxygalactose transaminase
MKNNRINVAKSFLPPIDEYKKYVDSIYSNLQLTNQGPFLCELETKLKSYLGVEHFHFLTNGTLALQLALSALDIRGGEIITTPFSYVATCSSILWERCTPVFVDIEPDNYTIDVKKIEEKITDKTRAIMAVHVFGYACDVEKIEKIAIQYDLKVIYDGAHAFGCTYKGKSLNSYGDVSTLSFHATKIFHTIEGGACIVNNKNVSDLLDVQKRFGHNLDDHLTLGINAKASEFQAVMGLCNLNYMKDIFAERKSLSELYDRELDSILERPKSQKDLVYNYSYYPVLFKNEAELLEVFKALSNENIHARRYFYPSLNTLPYVTNVPCPVSENISVRIACLPLYNGLSEENVIRICNTIVKTIKSFRSLEEEAFIVQ